MLSSQSKGGVGILYGLKAKQNCDKIHALSHAASKTRYSKLHEAGFTPFRRVHRTRN